MTTTSKTNRKFIKNLYKQADEQYTTYLYDTHRQTVTYKRTHALTHREIKLLKTHFSELKIYRSLGCF